jgi:2-isopropylmalate synthase
MTRAPQAFHVYDTTLRDGAQQEGLTSPSRTSSPSPRTSTSSASASSRAAGRAPSPRTPSSSPARAAELRCATPRSPRSARPGGPASARGRPAGPRAARLARAGRHPRRQERRAARREGAAHDPAENLAMIRDTVALPRGEGRRVFLDAEHFFDGYRATPPTPLEVRRGARRGRRRGRRPVRHQRRDAPARSRTSCTPSAEAPVGALGIHCHNDTGCAVANSLAAVDAGRATCRARSTATASGRNADLLAAGRRTSRSSWPSGAARWVGSASQPGSPRGQQIDERPAYSSSRSRRERLTPTRRGFTPVPSRSPRPVPAHRPHQGGNDMRMLVSDMAGRASIELKDANSATTFRRSRLLTEGGRGHRPGQALEAAGWTFEAARRVVRAPPA